MICPLPRASEMSALRAVDGTAIGICGIGSGRGRCLSPALCSENRRASQRFSCKGVGRRPMAVYVAYVSRALTSATLQ